MSDKYNTGPDDIVAKIADLERRLSVVERTPSLSNATIDSGTLTVKDPAGDIRVQLGLLADGTYGLSVKEEGQTSLHTVPFVYTDFVAAGELCSSASYVNLATVGPDVDVPIGSSGRILVIASAQIQYLGTPSATVGISDGRFDVTFSGANTRTPDENVDPLVGLWQQQLATTTNNTFANVISVTTQAVFEHLTPGVTTIRMVYRRSGAVTVDPSFFRRVLTVIKL